ncbi:MAG: hypothetical protein QM405_03090 [Euryarchaeota archaeon]|jgi:hypothetical protein|nr:hypothetical protein [Euryarchaeota archaeon]
MDKERFLLPAIIIVVLLVIVAVATSLIGNTTFKTGNVAFQYPNSWYQEQSIGNFDDQSLYSAVTLNRDFQSNNQTVTAYIIFQMQITTQGVLQLPSTGSITTNSTNSTVGTINIGDFKATQLGNLGPEVAQKVTIIQKDNFYYTIQYICPSSALNETTEAYNMILSTLQLS